MCQKLVEIESGDEQKQTLIIGAGPCRNQGLCGRPARPKRLIWPSLADARGSLRHDPAALKVASGEPSAEGLSHRVLDIGVGIALLALVFVGAGLFIDPIQTTSAGRGF